MDDTHSTDGDTAVKTVAADTPRSFGADMDMRQLMVSAERCAVVAPLGMGVAGQHGSLSVGAVANMFDIGASDPTMVACRPDWTATQDLALHFAAPVVDGPVVIDSRVVRVGKKVVVATADIYDGHGGTDVAELLRAADRGELTAAGSGILSFARIPGSAARDHGSYNPAEWIGLLRHRAQSEPVGQAMYERMGFRALDAAAGRFELERTPYLTNSIGTILGGAQAVMAEVAAEGIRPGMVAADMHIHFLAQLKGTAARSSARVIRDGTGHSVVEVSLTDSGTGTDGRLLALATVTLVAAS